MDKEFTYFIVDLSPIMGGKNNERTVSDLEYGLKYLFGVVSQKILRAKKTDQISVIGLHHPETENPLATDDSNTNIKIISKMQPSSISLLKDLKRQLKVNYDDFGDTEGDIIKALLVAFAMALEQTKGGKKSVINIVIITNNKTEMETDDELGEQLATILEKCNNARIHVASIDFNQYDLNDDIKRQNELTWRDLFKKISNGSSIFSYDELLALTTDISKSIPRLVRPVRTFDGELRLGCDLDTIDQLRFASKGFGVTDDLAYDQNHDPISLCMKVEGFPFIKKDSLTSAKTFSITASAASQLSEGQKIHPVKFIKDYRVRDITLDLNEDVTKSISLSETMNVFRYGSSFAPLTENFEKIAKFRSYPGIDIRGIMKLEDLPICYLTDESMIIVNKGDSGSQRDIENFNSMCLALLNLGSVAIVRYVLKVNSEVNMGALIPTIINADKLTVSEKRSHSDESLMKEAYSFALVRLPFKEDEKIPSFSRLSRVIKSEADKKFSKYIPDNEMLDIMTEYIEEMDLDKEDLKRQNDEKYLTPNEYEFSLPVPLNFVHMQKDIESKRLNKITASLMIPSPSINILQDILKKVIIEMSPLEKIDKTGDEEISLQDRILQNKARIDEIIKNYNDNLKIEVSKSKISADSEIVKKMVNLFDNRPIEQDGKNLRRSDRNEVLVKAYDNDEEFDIDEILASGY